MVRLTSFTTVTLGLLFSAPVVSGQAANSTPSSTVPTNATPITSLSPQGVEGVSQSTDSSAIAVAQAATAPAPTATLSAFDRSIPSGRSATLMWNSTNATTCSGTGF